MSHKSNTQPAILLQHPSATFALDMPPRDPREQPVAEPAAEESVGRLHFDVNSLATQDRDEQIRRINAVDTIQQLMDEFGADDVLRWALFASVGRQYVP